MALQDLASAEPTLVPQLLAALQNPNPRIRTGVATALAYVRPPVRAALPVLRKMSKDPTEDPSVRSAAALAAASIEAKEEEEKIKAQLLREVQSR